MKNVLLFTAFAVGALALTACGENQPPPAVHETRVVHHYHPVERASAPSNPDNFEPVERPTTYSR